MNFSVSANAKKGLCTNFAIISSILFLCGTAPTLVRAQTKIPSPKAVEVQKIIKLRARGTFEVKVIPAESTDRKMDFIRLLLDKQFQGDLKASSTGEMLTVDNGSKTSGGYVAIEKIVGTLNGRQGTFALQHSGTMTKDKMELTIQVVPESGTGELTGLTGRMTIKIEDEKHSYDFQYTLPQNLEIKSNN